MKSLKAYRRNWRCPILPLPCVHLPSLDFSSSRDWPGTIGPCNDGKCARCQILLKIELVGGITWSVFPSNRIWNGMQLNYTEQVRVNGKEIYYHMKAHCNYTDSNHIFFKKLHKILSATLGYATLHQIHKQGIATTDVPTDASQPLCLKFLKPHHM